MSIVHKTHESEFDPGMNCVLSDLSEDHYGDVVGDGAHPMLGWNITNFKKNPIALWSHNAREPIGTWRDVRVEHGALLGRLHMAPKGSSPRIDELSALLAAGVLKGISVGFIPSESKPRENGGRHFLRQTLVEASLVAIPANPSALLTAKALGVSKQTIDMIFKQDDQDDFMDENDCVVQMIEDGMDADEAVEFCSDIFNRRGRRLSDTLEKIAERQARTRAAYEAQARSHRDPPKPAFDNTWRGVKLPGLTWRGKKI
jgi:HK97 family phage prohead protease